jgi:hypothetical protein
MLGFRTAILGQDLLQVPVCRPSTRNSEKNALELEERMVRCRHSRHGSRIFPMDIAQEFCYLLCNVQRRDHECRKIRGPARHA